MYVKNEFDNYFDKNVVVIFKDREMIKRCVYFLKKYVKVLVWLFEENLLCGLVYFKGWIY